MLELHRIKVHRALLVLESSIYVGETILRHAQRIASLIEHSDSRMQQSHEQVETDLHQYLNVLRIHKEKSKDLLGSMQSVDILVRFLTAFALC